VFLSAVFIVKLSHFDDAKIQADEVEAQTAKKRTELSSVQSEVEASTKRKEILRATIANWQQRLEEMTAAEAASAAAKAQLVQLQKETDDLRQKREKLNADLPHCSKQVQAQKDLLATFDQKAANFKALQAAIEQAQVVLGLRSRSTHTSSMHRPDEKEPLTNSLWL
jgi:chromosome segregation ATPase